MSKLLFLTLFVLLSVTPFSKGLSKEPRKFILSFGLSQFKDPKFHSLQFAANDSQKVFKFFKKNWKGVVWKKNLFTSKKRPGKISHRTMKKAFQILSKKNTSEDDIVLIYVSTHGTISKDPRTGELKRYLVFPNTNSKNVPKTAVSFKEVQSMFSKLKSKRKVFILDSCFSGTGKSFIPEDIILAQKKQKSGSLPYELSSTARGEIYLFSSKADQTSLEDLSLGGSVYTNYLLEGFNIDNDKDGVVTITEAHGYARSKTRKFTKNQQDPTSLLNIKEVDPIVVKGKIDQKKSILRARLSTNKILEVYIDGELKGNLSEGIQFEAGKRKLVIRDPRQKGKKLFDLVFRFQGGKEYFASYLLRITQKKNIFDAQMNSLLFFGDEKDLFLPENALGFGFSFIRKGWPWTYDLGLEFLYYGVTDEKPRFAGPSFVLQNRQMYLANLALGQSENLSFLSSGDGKLITNFRWKLGASLLGVKVERSFRNASNKDLEIEKTSPGTSYKPGVHGGLGINFNSLLINVRANIGVNFYYFSSPFDQGSSFLFSLSPYIGLGLQW